MSIKNCLSLTNFLSAERFESNGFSTVKEIAAAATALVSEMPVQEIEISLIRLEKKSMFVN